MLFKPGIPQEALLLTTACVLTVLSCVTESVKSEKSTQLTALFKPQPMTKKFRMDVRMRKAY